MKTKWTILRARHLNNNGKWNHVTMQTIIAVWTKLHNTCSNWDIFYSSSSFFFLLFCHGHTIDLRLLLMSLFVSCWSKWTKLKHNFVRSFFNTPKNWWQFCQNILNQKFVLDRSHSSLDSIRSEQRHAIIPLFISSIEWLRVIPRRVPKWKRNVCLCDHFRWHTHSARDEGRLSANFNGIGYGKTPLFTLNSQNERGYSCNSIFITDSSFQTLFLLTVIYERIASIFTTEIRPEKKTREKNTLIKWRTEGREKK